MGGADGIGGVDASCVGSSSWYRELNSLSISFRKASASSDSW